MGYPTIFQGGITAELDVDENLVIELDPIPATAALNVFAPSLRGLVPAPAGGGGDAAKFLRGDATWQTVIISLDNLNASNLTSGTVPDARFPATLPAASGVNLTALNASNVTSGTLAALRGGTGVSNAGTFTNANNTTVTGGGTIGLGGFTLTVPATGTAALLATANIFTQDNTFPSITGNDALFEITGKAGSAGGAGGDVIIQAGTGSAASGGGGVSILGGTGGAGLGGPVVIDSGTGSSGGAVTVGTANAQAVTIGRATKTTTINGTFVASIANVTGSLADARLSANVPLLNAANTFTQNQTIPGILAQNTTLTIDGLDATVGNTAGGSLDLTSGTGFGTGNGGALTLLAGSSGAGATGNGGSVNISAGPSLATTGLGGSVDINGGLGSGTGNGGSVSFYAGTSGSGASGNGGFLLLGAGNAASTNGTGGAIYLSAGYGSGTQQGGNIDITAGQGGPGATAFGGVVSIYGGASGGADNSGGGVNLNGGIGTGSQKGGDVTLNGGSSTHGGAQLSLEGGIGNAGGGYGNILMNSGPGGGMTFTCGAATATANSGTSITLTSGVNGGDNGTNCGAITLQGANATGTNGNGGALYLYAGEATQAGTGGPIEIIGGSTPTTAQGGAITIRTGLATGAGTSGTLTMDTGQANGLPSGTLNLGANNAITINIGHTGTTITLGGTISGSILPTTPDTLAIGDTGNALDGIFLNVLRDSTSAIRFQCIGSSATLVNDETGTTQISLTAAQNIIGDVGTPLLLTGLTVNIDGRDAVSGNAAGGTVAITSGNGNGTGAGGLASLIAGNSGAGATGNGGAISILAGNAASTNGSGGALNIDAGAKTGSGTAGVITIGEANAESVAIGRATKSIGFFGVAVATRQAVAALTNNVTSGGTDDVIANFTDLVIYGNDAAAIRNNIYQLSRKLKQATDALRLYGLFS